MTWLERQIATVRRFEAPVVVLWGPPGSGKRAILRGLVEEGAVLLGPEVGPKDHGLESGFAITDGELHPDPSEWRPFVPPGLTVVMSAPRCPPSGPPSGLGGSAIAQVSPAMMALEIDEVADLLGLERGKTSAKCCAKVAGATLGIRRLVALVHDHAITNLEQEHPSVASYVHDEILPWLGEEAAILAFELALAESWVVDPSRRFDPLVDVFGLARRSARGLALPPLLVPTLRAEAELHLGPAVCQARRRRWELLRSGAAEARVRAPAPTTTRSCRFALHLLGAPSLYRFDPNTGQWEKVELGAPSAWLLLARLASSHGRPVSLLDLEEALLDGEEGEAPALHPILSRIRGRLGDPASIQRQGNGYVLGPTAADWWVDFEELDHTTKAVEPDEEPRAAELRLQQARVLGKGLFLEGLERRWLRRPRQRARERRQEALLRLGELLVRQGDADRALDVIDELIAEEPTHERAFLVSMRILAGQSRRDAVHRRYAELCTVLADELGVVPSSETTQEYHRLLGL